MPLSELLDGSLDVLHATLLPHRLRGEVAVSPRSVPVSSNGLGGKRDHDTKILRYTLEDIPENQTKVHFYTHLKQLRIPGHPEVIAHRDSLARSDLELPLGGHHLDTH